jgi:hypothetical protein
MDGSGTVGFAPVADDLFRKPIAADRIVFRDPVPAVDAALASA